MHHGPGADGAQGRGLQSFGTYKSNTDYIYAERRIAGRKSFGHVLSVGTLVALALAVLIGHNARLT